MKNSRQRAILDIISTQDIATQEDLVQALLDRGVAATQATVSRDIKELNLTKSSSGKGKFRYVIGDTSGGVLSERFVRLFNDSVVSVQAAQNIVVLKTLPGTAGAAAEAVDSMHMQEIVGTMAGENTIFIVSRNNAEAALVEDVLKRLIR